MDELSDNPISLRMPFDLKQWLATYSKEQGRSMNAQIVYFLQQQRRAIESAADAGERE